MIFCKRLLTLLAVAAASSEAQTQKTGSLDGEASLAAGAEYNSNLNIPQLDQSAGKGDWATTLKAGLKGTYKANKRLSFSGRYQLDWQNYAASDQFDLMLHTGGVGVQYDWGAADIGADYTQARARLDGQSFLTLHRADLSAGVLQQKTLYWRAGLFAQDKIFNDGYSDRISQRDANGEGVSLDTFWFYNDTGDFVLLGIERAKEDARADALSYDQWQLKSRYVNKHSVGDKEAKLTLQWRYQMRDYHTPQDSLVDDTAQNRPKRDDRRHRLSARWELTLSQYLMMEAKVTYGLFDSTDPSADYKQTVAGLTLKSAF